MYTIGVSMRQYLNSHALTAAFAANATHAHVHRIPGRRRRAMRSREHISTIVLRNTQKLTVIRKVFCCLCKKTRNTLNIQMDTVRILMTNAIAPIDNGRRSSKRVCNFVVTSCPREPSRSIESANSAPPVDVARRTAEDGDQPPQPRAVMARTWKQ